MSGPQLYRIRFMAKIRPKGWELVDGKTFRLLPSRDGEAHYVPADIRWPTGAPTRIALGDAKVATEHDPAG